MTETHSDCFLCKLPGCHSPHLITHSALIVLESLCLDLFPCMTTARYPACIDARDVCLYGVVVIKEIKHKGRHTEALLVKALSAIKGTFAVRSCLAHIMQMMSCCDPETEHKHIF